MNRLPLVSDAPGTPFGKTMANHPDLQQAFDGMQKAIGATLEEGLVEMVRLRVASNNGCEY